MASSSALNRSTFDPTQDSTLLRPRALVLGSSVAIARALEEEGYQPVLESQLKNRLSRVSGSLAIDHLRACLSEFAELASASTSSYAPCVHPGTGPWAERQEVGLVAQELGLNVISPAPRLVSLFSNKLTLLGEAEKLGIPTPLLGSEPLSGVREVEELIESQGRVYPFVLKAVRGGEGSGVLVIQTSADLSRKLPLWLDELRARVGDSILFAERYLEGAKRVSVPFVRFQDGRFRLFPLVDSSLQCRYRKIIEFCPAGQFEAGIEEQIQAWTYQLLDRCGYVGVGVLEFLVDGSRCWLINGMSRLNSGYALWEKVAGTSAVAWQLAALKSRLASGLPELSPRREWNAGVAIRLYAEDPLLQLPQPGHVREIAARNSWKLPNAEAELELFAEVGKVISPDSDGLLAKLVVGARDSRQALTVARGILDEIWIAGSLQTNERFISELLLHPWVKEGMFHASFVDEEFIPEVRPEPEILRVFASLGAAHFAAGRELRWAVGDQWVKPDPALLNWVEGPEEWDHHGLPGISGILEVPDGRKLRVCAFPIAENRWQVRIGAWTIALRAVVPLTSQEKAKKAGQHRLVSLVSGRVHSVLFREGTIVPAHEPLVIVESLQTLVPHALPVDVRVLKWAARAENAVHSGQDLAFFETVSQSKS